MKKYLKGRRPVQMSESLIAITFLALSGGLQDAYTYIARGGVFANAQTGNIVLLSVNLLEGNGAKALHYLIPLLFFATGIMVAELIRTHCRSMKRLHWRQVVVLAEIVLLFFVGLLPADIRVLANSIVSFTCAMQVQTFRKIDGYGFSSTMCIGNLRSGVEALYAWHMTRDQQVLKKAGRYFTVIFLFAVGAGIGGLMLPCLGTHTIWISCSLLMICFGLMFVKAD